MKLKFWEKDAPNLEEKSQFEDVLRRLVLSQDGKLGSIVTPDTCMESPTVNAIVTAVSRRMASTPVHVYKKTVTDGKPAKEIQTSHTVETLLQRPNEWQSNYDFWQDATSTLLRYGNFYGFKSQGTQGPIRQLLPLNSGEVTPKQDTKTWKVTYEVGADNMRQTYEPRKILHIRGAARNYLEGDSAITDVSTTIALEILAERFGANFFKNGAIPLLIFTYTEGASGFSTEDQEKEFIAGLKEAFGGNKQMSSMLLPKGIDKPTPANFKADEAQFLETRKLQRTIISGAFGVPPHLVGDLERGTFNNVEQQDKDFTMGVVLPVAKNCEAAMERDLLTAKDRREGLIIRFNLDAILRAAFKERQEGLRIQRDAGIITANEWREREGMNPRDDEFGDKYLHPGNMLFDGEEEEDDEPNGPPVNQEPE